MKISASFKSFLISVIIAANSIREAQAQFDDGLNSNDESGDDFENNDDPVHQAIQQIHSFSASTWTKNTRMLTHTGNREQMPQHAKNKIKNNNLHVLPKAASSRPRNQLTPKHKKYNVAKFSLFAMQQKSNNKNTPAASSPNDDSPNYQHSNDKEDEAAALLSTERQSAQDRLKERVKALHPMNIDRRRLTNQYINRIGNQQNLRGAQ